jgi:hypothetical protein
MASVTVGMIFHADPAEIEQIVQLLQQQHNIRVICVKQTWGKLWLKEGDRP